jgi:hypothetical protein
VAVAPPEGAAKVPPFLLMDIVIVLPVAGVKWSDVKNAINMTR